MKWLILLSKIYFQTILVEGLIESDCKYNQCFFKKKALPKVAGLFHYNFLITIIGL